MTFVQFNGEHIGCFKFESNSTFVVDFRLHTQFNSAIKENKWDFINAIKLDQINQVSRYHAKKNPSKAFTMQ